MCSRMLRLKEFQNDSPFQALPTADTTDSNPSLPLQKGKEIFCENFDFLGDIHLGCGCKEVRLEVTNSLKTKNSTALFSATLS